MNINWSNLALGNSYYLLSVVWISCLHGIVMWQLTWYLFVDCVQEEDHCCNNCEEVREAYRKKGWALSNPDLIDQVDIYCIL